MKVFLLAISLVTILTGCAPANITSHVRPSAEPGFEKITRCVDFKTGDEEKVDKILQSYDGMRMVYVSEYTTSNKATTSMVMCFEKPADQG
jgi:hypothetical protein